jgi:hypothetical protein
MATRKDPDSEAEILKASQDRTRAGATRGRDSSKGNDDKAIVETSAEAEIEPKTTIRRPRSQPCLPVSFQYRGITENT